MQYKCPKCGNAIEEGISPCPTCGQQFNWPKPAEEAVAPVQEPDTMFCSKCGKQINAEAVICPNCGCPTQNYNAAPTNNIASQNQYSGNVGNDVALREWISYVKTTYILSIIGLVCTLGIGFIFDIITLIRIKHLPVSNFSNLTDAQSVEYELAQNKAKKADKFARASLGLILATFGIVFYIVLFTR